MGVGFGALVHVGLGVGSAVNLLTAAIPVGEGKSTPVETGDGTGSTGVEFPCKFIPHPEMKISMAAISAFRTHFSVFKVVMGLTIQSLVLNLAFNRRSIEDSSFADLTI